MLRVNALFSSTKLIQCAVAILLCVFAFAVLHYFRAIEISDNSLVYAYNAKTRTRLFYAPHLLHAVFLRMAFIGFSSIMVDCDVICAGQLYTMLWAVTALLSIYYIVRKILLSTTAAVVVVMFTFVTHGFWVFSTQLEVYVPVAGSLALITAMLVTSGRGGLGSIKVACISLVWAVSIFHHQANVIFIAPLACYFFAFQGRDGWRQLSIISVLSGTIVLSTYVLAYSSVYSDGNVEQFMSWVVGLANVPTTDWGTVDNWSLKPILRAVSSQVNSIAVLQEYLVNSETLPLSQVTIGVTLMSIVAGVIFAAVIWNAVRAITRAPIYQWRLFFACWFVTYFFFFAWWSPGVSQFYIPSLVPITILCALAIKDVVTSSLNTEWVGRVGAGGLAILFILMAGLNSSSVLMLRQSRGLDIYEAEVLNALAPTNCVIYTKGFYLNVLRYFLGRPGDKMKSLRSMHVDFYRVATGDKRPNYKSVSAEIPDDYSKSGEDCALIRLGYVTPEYFERKFDPSKYGLFLRWFFDVDNIDQAGSIAYNEFRVVSFKEGPPHLLIDRSTKVEAANIDALMQAIEGYSKKAEQTFGPGYWAMRSTKVNPRRSRKFIFGYGSPGVPLAMLE